ncbi:MAG: hypothetical protein U1E65_20695 [Myxococcota bacterium]
MATGIAGSISQVSTECYSDTTVPAKLEVSLARYGDLNQYQSYNWNRAADPLLLMLKNVEPGCSFQVLNLSDNPDADWSNADLIKTLPSKTMKPLGDGRYGVVLGNKEAKAAGIEPGDVFEIRQVEGDGTGKAGPETRVFLDQKPAATNIQLSQFGTVDQFGTNVNLAQSYQLALYGDSRAPKALPQNMQIEGLSADKGVFRGKRAIEPGAEVFVHNEVTKQTFSGKVGDDRTFAVDFEASVGAPLHLWVKDHNNQVTDLGMTNYTPKCVKGGPCGVAELMKQSAA